MKNFIGRHKGNDDLERQLRRDRPEPRPEFLAMLSDRIEDRPRRRRGVSARVALVGAVSAVMLIAMSAVGGLSYAATAVQGVAAAAEAVVVAPVSKPGHKQSAKSGKKQSAKSANRQAAKSAAADSSKPDKKEYGHKTQVCHKPGKNQETIEVDANAVPAHLAHGDTLGPCPPPAKKK